MSSSEQEALGERAVALGYLSEAQVGDALRRYAASGRAGDFGDFLLEQGLVTLEQFAELQPDEEDMGATMAGEPVGDPLLDRVFSGCVIERKLGQGGMGAVYLALRESDGQPVVVKFLASEQATNRTWRARFVREAQVMMRVSHPNIVSVYDLEGEGDTPHIVMELVEGEPLDEALTARGAFEPLEAARLIRDAALGLAHAHAAGIVHRDIKPANLFLTRSGALKILDFGLAKNVEVDDGLSMPGQVLGTPHYMAPEQWGDHRVDARCDVFSLGATLYHLVTGLVPFAGKTPRAISENAMTGQFAPPRELSPEVPQDLELVIFRMLAVDREFRYPSAAACAADLQRVLDGAPVDVPRLVEVGGARDGRRYPLLPQKSFVLGRESGCDVPIDDISVSRQHARIDRGRTGFVLHDLGSSYGSFVGGMRIRDVALKDGDEVRLGKVSLRFRDGGYPGTSPGTARLSPDRLRVGTRPWPIVQALIGEADRRVVLTLLEELAPDSVEARTQAAMDRLREHLGGEVAEEAGKKASVALRKLRVRAPRYLFSITHENLGDDAAAWLEWWANARPSFPPQLAPRRSVPRVRLLVRRGEPEERAIDLASDEAVFEVGRDEACKVSLHNRSVSRHHSTLVRLHRRLAIRDEGSRFGTLLNGARVREVFLEHGDRITLGQVELEVHVEPPAPVVATEDGGEAYPIEPEAFFALVQLGHPAATLGLVRLLEQAEDLDWVDAAAAGLFPEDGDAAERLAAQVRKAYAREGQRARELLGTLLGEPGDDAAAHRAQLAAQRDRLGAQFLPEGWFPKQG